AACMSGIAQTVRPCPSAADRYRPPASIRDYRDFAHVRPRNRYKTPGILDGTCAKCSRGREGAGGEAGAGLVGGEERRQVGDEARDLGGGGLVQGLGDDEGADRGRAGG